jgi:pimeloyl-ACP methyl ester carboxylesterase
MLPSFSTISTRAELRPLALTLAPRFTTWMVDWPGFGESARPRLLHRSALHIQFLDDFTRERFDHPVPVIAAGHGATIALRLAERRPTCFDRLALIAPTWRGPLPTAMGPRRVLYRLLEALVRLPLLGAALYALNTTESFIGWMMRRHVYANPEMVSAELLAMRSAVARQRGARFGAAAFVTGGLDAVATRDEWLTLVERCASPLFIVIGDRTPPKSRAEMDALVAGARCAHALVPGALAPYEEHPTEVAEALSAFLAHAPSVNRSLL